MRIAVALVACLFLAVGASMPPVALAASTLNRAEDPVVLSGADIPSLQGVAPATIVAFRYAAGWQQVPVQVDQRFSQTLLNVYNNTSTLPGNTNISVLVYADPNTFTGADPNPTIDTDDEIAFMSKDAGGQAPLYSEPGHVVRGSGVQLTITDPLQPGSVGYVYLFKQDGALDPAAGQAYVSYTFNLNSGNYKTNYNLNGTYGTTGNPENSTVTTAYYARRFSDRWADDQLTIKPGVTTPVNILDRHKSLFAPGYCGRSEDTFDLGTPAPNRYQGEGAFVTNKVGPVRAIRSYIGANSGPNTQREHVFYAQREDIRTYLRVHAIPSIMDFFDYGPAAFGMTYYNDLNLGGVTIDGVPDAPVLGPIHWEMVTGSQGSLVLSGATSTNIPGFNYTSYYLDSSIPNLPTLQCTGDPYAYGSSGVYVNMGVYLPNTDPGTGATNYLNTVRTLYYEPPGLATASASAFSARANTPLSVTTTAWTPSVGGRAAEVDPGALGGSRGPSVSSSVAWPASIAGGFALALLLAWRRNRSGRSGA
jgi:hypothetical protein